MRRIIAFLICFTMIAGGFEHCMAASAVDLPPDAPYIEAVEFLAALGVTEYADGRFRPEELLTRAELADMLAKLKLTQADGIKGSYPDVPADHPNASAIAAADRSGLLDAYADGSFRPDSGVSYNELCYVLVRLLGFTVKAEYCGGYPGGYQQIAGEKKLMNNLSFKWEEPAERGIAALIIYRALQTDMLKQVRYGAEVSWEETEGCTLLSEYMKIYKAEGRLTATPYASIADNGIYNNLTVQIEFENYTVKDSSFYGFLGYKVKCFYRIDDYYEKPMVVWMTPMSSNSVLEISAEDILSGGEGKITYEQNNDIKHASVPKSASVLYNGRLYPEYDSETLKPKRGSVRLLDNDGNGSYDVIFVEEYEVCLYYGADESGKELFTDTGSIILDRGTDTKTEVIDLSSGKTIAVGRIKQDSFISILQSKDGEYIRIYAGAGTVEGTITGIGEDTVSVDGRIYSLMPGFTVERKPGDRALFYLDYKGNIAGTAEDYEGGEAYGFLLQIAEIGGLQKDVWARIYTSGEQFAEYKLADKLEIDGVRVNCEQAADELRNAALAANGKNKGVSQLVRYRINGSGELIYLDTACKGSEENSDNLTLDYADSATVLYKSSGVFSGRFNVGSKTKIFLIPDNEENRHPGNNSYLFGVKGKGYLKNDTRYPQTGVNTYMEAYNFNDVMTASVVVLYMSDTARQTVDDHINIFVTEEISEVCDEEGEVTLALSGMTGGKKVQYTVMSDIPINQTEENTVSAGDVLALSVGAGNKITGIQKVFDYNSKKILTGSSGYADYHYYQYGTAYSKDSQFFALRFDDLQQKPETYLASNVVIFDTRRKKLRSGSLTEMRDELHYDSNADSVFVNLVWGITRDVVIYR